MRGLASAEQPRVAKEIVVKFNRTNDRCINDRASGAVPATVGNTIGCGEKDDLVVLANDDECDLRFEL
jgi:hypothetical protein